MKTKYLYRLLFLSSFLFILFFFIVLQFYQLQITDEKKWSSCAKAQHQFSVIEPFRRGRFFSNSDLHQSHFEKELPFVYDVKKYHFFVDPLAIPKDFRNEITKYISDFFSMDWKEKNTLCKQFEKRCHSRRLKMWVEESDKKKIEKWWSSFAKWKKIPLNGIYFVQDYQRSYPYGKLLGSVLHTIRDDRDPKTHQAFPTGGLELYFDSVLQGKTGKRLLLRSPSHEMESGVLLEEPEDGADIYLTIHQYIQAIAEEEIQHAVKNSGAKSGWAVMMNPNTGEIYALAQYPSFDPSNYRKFYNTPSLIDSTKVHAVTDCFEPGSTMKPISVAIALLANDELKRQGKEPIFEPADMISTDDGTFPGRKNPIRDVGAHRFLNMYLAIQKSSNIYVAKLIQRVISTLGDDWYRRQLQDIFGFGVETGIELPSESSGLLPLVNKRYKNGFSHWSTSTPYSLSIGYNLLVNSIQLMRAFSIIANGGYVVKPTIVKKIVKDEKVIFEHNKKNRKKILTKEISRELTYALKSVTKAGGAGVRADVAGFTEAGKTGTTEKIIKGTYSNKHHFSSFIGFSPAENPQFLLYVAIDEPEYRYLPGIGKTYFGGKCAAPAFKQIMERTFKYLGIPPDDPHGYMKDDPRADREKADWSQQVNILQKLYDQWNK